MSYSAAGNPFEIQEWCGSGPPALHVHHADDEAWHVLDGTLTFRYEDRTETAGPGTTVFIPAGVAHTFEADKDARYLIILTPNLRALIRALHADRSPENQHEIYHRFGSELLE
jgi:mannose-6-phosphate isomerase-like protein (cupin superfamily)